jgi:transposase
VAIIGGLDVHRRQITYDYLDTETGEVSAGKIIPANRQRMRAWVSRFRGTDADFALEATTGWRFIAEELSSAGLGVHLADPAEVRALKGRKKRAKTDRVDARHLRELNVGGRIPACWTPPAHLLELRTRLRLYRTLSEQRKGWSHRIQAQLFHQGVPAIERLRTKEGLALLEKAELSPAGRQVMDVALSMIHHLDECLDTIKGEIVSFARRQAGCKALAARYGIGPVTAAVMVSEIGDARRFTSSREVVRLSGLDITVYDSDGKRSAGKLSRQGPPILRWALYEAGKCASRGSSPDHAYYLETKDRVGHNRATLSVARKLAREGYHTLRGLGDEAIAPPEPLPAKQARKLA